MILREEANVVYAVRETEQQVLKELESIEEDIEEVLKLHAPMLLTQKAQWMERKKEIKKQVEAAEEKLKTALEDVAKTMADPYGQGRVFPYAVIEQKTFVQVTPGQVGTVAAWLAARGMEHCIKLTFTPIDAFKTIPEIELPRTADGRQPALRVYEGPNAKLFTHSRWEQWGVLNAV